MLKSIKLLAATAACVTFALSGAVFAVAEVGELNIPSDYLVETDDEIDEPLVEDTVDYYYNGFYYTINDDDTVTITNYTGSSTELVIPDTIEGKKVTVIGDSAFSFCDSLTSVTISDGIISIDAGAFRVCTNLTSVIIPDSVTFIGYGAFMSCMNLTSISIPDSVTTIEGSLFADCAKLASVTIPPSITSIENKMFEGCSSLKSLTIPTSIISIENYAFDGCTALNSIRIPYGVKYIGAGAFDGCTSLTSVIIPTSVTSIGGGAFALCSSLKSIKIPDGVKSIEANTFVNCTSLTSVTIPKSVTSIKDYAFQNCKNVTIYGYTESYAETYARGRNISFVYLDEEEIIFTVAATSANRSVILSWDKVSNATGYIVKSADGKTQYTTKSITDTFYTVTGLKNGTQYRFKVYASVNGKWYGSSTVSKTPVAKPENVTAIANNKKVTLSWDKVANATGYIVKSADGNTQYTKSSIKTNSYTVTGLNNGTQYKFKVYAYSDGKWFASSTISKTPTCSPQNLKAVAGTQRITLSWDKVDGATGYIVKSNDGTIQYTKNAIKTNSYTVTGLTGGTQYKFKVYAYVDGKWYASGTVTRTAKK